MRGRLIFPFLADVCRLDTAAIDYDPDFKEPGIAGRQEHPPVRIPCQVEPGIFEALQMAAAGNVPNTRIDVVVHFADLERLGLVDESTGDALLRVGDRLAGLYDTRGRLVQAIATPPGLYVTEARPGSYGLSLADPRRNLLLVTFQERVTAAPREA